MRRDAFDSVHPIIAMAFFVFALIMPMLFMHPAMLAISLFAASAWYFMIKGKRGTAFLLKFILPMMLFVIVLNPMINHRGMSVLFYIKHTPFTLEAICNGAASAAMFGSVLIWFACFNSIMTSDKLIYLFGRVLPSLSLLISMTLRFVPMFVRQAKKIALGMKCMGQNTGKGSIKERVRNGLAVISALTTWALEGSIITADSMRARGYGINRRTTFSIWRFNNRDAFIGILLAIGIGSVSIGIAMNAVHIRYFPRLVMNGFDYWAVLCCLIYFLTLLTPIILNVREAVIWRSLKSRI